MKKTNWAKATTDVTAALTNLMFCSKSQKLNCWIEVQKNGEQEFPIMMKNPALDNPFNWDFLYGVPSQPDYDQKYFNETEKDLTLNYTACFGEAKAIEQYQKKGKISKGMFRGIGICHPVKKSDVIKFRKDLKKLGWNEESLWTTHWQPKKNIPCYIPQPIDRVYVICTDDKPYNEQKIIKGTIIFLQSLIKN